MAHEIPISPNPVNNLILEFLGEDTRALYRNPGGNLVCLTRDANGGVTIDTLRSEDGLVASAKFSSDPQRRIDPDYQPSGGIRDNNPGQTLQKLKMATRLADKEFEDASDLIQVVQKNQAFLPVAIDAHPLDLERHFFSSNNLPINPSEAQIHAIRFAALEQEIIPDRDSVIALEPCEGVAVKVEYKAQDAVFAWSSILISASPLDRPEIHLDIEAVDLCLEDSDGHLILPDQELSKMLPGFLVFPNISPDKMYTIASSPDCAYLPPE
jgi:hypothetical protein